MKRIVLIVAMALLLAGCDTKENETEHETIGVSEPTEIEIIDIEDSAIEIDSEDEDDPQFGAMTKQEEAVESDDVSNSAAMSETNGVSEDEGNEQMTGGLPVKGVNENSEVTCGIDVAKYQGTIDWKKVANSGVSYAMVRVGYRTAKDGTIQADTNARFNMQEASANGIKIGAYFFSTAITKEEAVEEADWVANYIAQYPITYPVAYNCEGFTKPDSRQYSLTNSQRTEIARAFLDEIYKKGYTPMFYASKGELENNASWDTVSLENNYKMWVAYYPGEGYDYTKGPSYSGKYCMWQYTESGVIDGIGKKVDINIANFGYSESVSAKDDTAPEVAVADAEALMNFKEVNEVVTAKNKTNLRDIPSQGEDSEVLYTLINPDTAVRTGISDSGWSRLVYGDKVCYAVSSFLTTDTSAPPQQAATKEVAKEPENGIKTKFTDCDDMVTAKQEVNLRTLPSVTNEQSLVVCTLHNGDMVHRTGYNQEYGWSRIEMDGQILYCISSYVFVVQ